MIALIKKVDLVMWTRNGATTLPFVLKRIDKVIPNDFVDNRLVVDDQSIDETPKIAESFGWTAVSNKGSGISDGANTALKNIETEYFISFEQDVLLAYDWWDKIPSRILEPRVAVASGLRFVDYPLGLKKLQEYSSSNYQKQDKPESYFPFAKTIDNTIYKTQVIRQIGGFPQIPGSVGVDQALSRLIFLHGFIWKVNYRVHSVHLRRGLKDELSHTYWYGSHFEEIGNVGLKGKVGMQKSLLSFLFSGAKGLIIAVKKNAAEIIYIYPLIRLSYLRGLVSGRKGKV